MRSKKDEWYKDRILWKAEKNYLFEFNCIKFEKLDNAKQEYIRNVIPKDLIPIIIFFKDLDIWTILCTQSLISYYNGKLEIILKEQFNQKITPHITRDSTVINKVSQKKDAKWLYLNETKQYIWFPSAEDMWNFWGVLEMLSRLK